MSAAAGILLCCAVAQAEIRVATGRSESGSGFAFESVPAPAVNDAAATARFTLVDGAPDPNAAQLGVLHDGRVPADEDQPAENFFFRAGTDGGRIRLDLGNAIPVKRVGTYSWHPGTRAPQVYVLYASDGTESGFRIDPKRDVDPTRCGWKRIARVDTRTDGDPGGQHGAAIADDAGVIGTYRYLLFDIARTEDRDPFGNTFYSEIDVLDARRPAPTSIESPKEILQSFQADGGKFRFTVNLTQAADLEDWCEKKLRPVVQAWYPKLVAMLPSEGYRAPASLTFRFRDDMRGTPASAQGARINLNAQWFRSQRDREAIGAVVHEMVHVVQGYWSRRRPGGSPAPGWVVEGIADYIRWFLFEPETKGAEITERSFPQARYDASYRITANFLDWVVRHHDPQIIRKLNAVAREGRYSEQLWKEWTGQSLAELGDQWKAFHRRRLSDSCGD